MSSRSFAMSWWLLAFAEMYTPFPTSAAPFAYITNFGDGTVSVIDTAKDTVVATIPVSYAPFGVAVLPSGQKVYVTNEGDGSVSVIDATTNAVRTTIAEAGGYGIAASPDGASVYAVSAGGYGETVAVSILSTDLDRVVKTIPIGLRGGFDDLLGIVVSPDGRFAFVLTGQPDTEQYPCRISQTACMLILYSIDTARGEISSFALLGSGQYRPAGFTFNPTADKLYVAEQNVRGSQYQLPIFSVSDFFSTVGFVTSIPGIPARVEFDLTGERMFVTDYGSDSLLIVDAAVNTVIDTIDVGRAPFGMALDSTGTRVYLANEQSDTVSVVDTVARKVVDTIPVGHFPEAFGHFLGPPGVVLVPTPTPTNEPTLTSTPAATEIPTATGTVTPSSTLAATQTAPPSPTSATCTADCNGNGVVEVDELVKAVSIALGVEPLGACPAAGCHAATGAEGFEGVTIDCLVRAVGFALLGCPT